MRLGQIIFQLPLCFGRKEEISGNPTKEAKATMTSQPREKGYITF